MSEPGDYEANRPLADAEGGGLTNGDEYVRWAYRLLLGREPEHHQAVVGNPFKDDRQQLLRSMLFSEEFQRANPFILAPMPSRTFSVNMDEIVNEISEAVTGKFDEVALLHDYRRLDPMRRARVLLTLREMQRTGLTRPWKQESLPEITQADIAALFRLILGRNPGSLEWSGHLKDHLGRELNDVVRAFLTSLEFARRGLLQPHLPEAIVATSLEGFSIYAAADDKAVGVHILAGSYEPHVTAAFRRYLRPEMNVIDVGANIGYFTMLAASIVGAAGMVTAVEANPDNAKLIEASRRLNDYKQIRIANVATGREIGIVSLNTDHSNGITASMPNSDDLWRARTVPCIPLQQLIAGERRIDFIKIDVEGAEYLAFTGFEAILKRDHPVLVSEFFPDAIYSNSGVTGEVYLRFLVECGFELGVIQPDGDIRQFGIDIAGVIRAWELTGEPHMDIVAAPPT